MQPLADKQGFEIVREFVDVETAKVAGRKAFGEMVSFLRRHRDCRVVLAEKTDRLYRNFKDYVVLEDLDVEIHLPKEGHIIFQFFAIFRPGFRTDQPCAPNAIPFAGELVKGLRHKIRIAGYSLAVISVVLAFLLRLLVDPWLGNQSPYLLFVVAVAVTGLYAGIRPALLAAALGTGVAYFCFVPPRYEWGFAGVSDAVGFAVYLLGVAGVILLTRARIRATEKSEQHRMQAEEILLKTERLSAAGQMASLLAHEINNPLAALTNVMFLLNQQPLSSPSRELLIAGTDALYRVNRIAGMTMGFFFEKKAPVPVRIREIVYEVAAHIEFSAAVYWHSMLTRF